MACGQTPPNSQCARTRFALSGFQEQRGPGLFKPVMLPSSTESAKIKSLHWWGTFVQPFAALVDRRSLGVCLAQQGFRRAEAGKVVLAHFKVKGQTTRTATRLRGSSLWALMRTLPLDAGNLNESIKVLQCTTLRSCWCCCRCYWGSCAIGAIAIRCLCQAFRELSAAMSSPSAEGPSRRPDFLEQLRLVCANELAQHSSMQISLVARALVLRGYCNFPHDDMPERVLRSALTEL